LLKKIGLKNFKSHKNSIIEFNEGFNIIVGPNGAGKSSIIEALVLALYDKFELGKNRKDLCLNKSEENPYEIKIEIEKGDKVFLIEKKYNKSSDIIKINNFVVKKEELQNKLDVYSLRPFIVLQEEIKDLTDEKKASDIVEEISKISYIVELIDLLKEIKKDLNKELNFKKEKFESINNLLKELTQGKKIEDFKDEISKLKSELKEKINRLENKLKEKFEELKGKEREKEILSKNIKEFFEKKEKLTKIIEEKSLIEREIALLRKEKENLEKEIGEIEDFLNKNKEIENKYKNLLILEQLENKRRVFEEKIKSLEKKEEEFRFTKEKKEELTNRIMVLLSSLNIEGKRDLSFYELILSKLKRRKEKLIEESSKKKRIEEEIKGKNLDLEELKIRYNDLLNLEKKMEELKESLAKNRQKIEELKEKKRLLKDNKCPVCLRSFSNKEKESIIEHYDKEIKKIKEEIEKKEKDIKIIEEKLSKKEELLRLIEEAKRIKKLKEELKNYIGVEDKLKKISNIIEELERLILEIKETNKFYLSLEKEIEELNKIKNNLEKTREEIKKISEKEPGLMEKKDEIIYNYKKLIENKRKIKEVKEKLISTNKKLEQDILALKEKEVEEREITNFLNKIDIKKLENKLKEVEKEIKDLIDHIKDLEISLNNLKKEFESLEEKEKMLKRFEEELINTKNSIDLLEKELKDVEKSIDLLLDYKSIKESFFYSNLSKIASNIIDYLTNGKFNKVKIKKEDKIKFYVVSNGIEYNPYYLSGGEQTVFSLALRLAIAELYSLEKKDIFLILDEPTIHLDKEVIRRFILYLQENKRYKQLIIISHDEEFSSIADNLIKVYKGKDGFSKVEINH